MRNVENRYRGLPPRTPEMLYNIVRKFYRGAVSHYDLIQEKKAEVHKAWQQYQRDGKDAPMRDLLHTLFLEFHFYTTCWLQIELALYRLAAQNQALARVREAFQSPLEKHLAVRRQLDQTKNCVDAQFAQDPGLSCVERDAYRFDGVTFTVDRESLRSLHELYQAIQTAKNMHE